MRSGSLCFGVGFATAFAAWFFAGNGLETGPAGVPAGGFFRGRHGLSEADCGVFVESVMVFRWWERSSILAES